MITDRPGGDFVLPSVAKLGAATKIRALESAHASGRNHATRPFPPREGRAAFPGLDPVFQRIALIGAYGWEAGVQPLSFPIDPDVVGNPRDERIVGAFGGERDPEMSWASAHHVLERTSESVRLRGRSSNSETASGSNSSGNRLEME